MSGTALVSPFLPAQKVQRKLKIFLWGSWGTGKTTLALQSPAPAVLDLDGGSLLYGDKYSFDVLRSTDIAEIKNSIAYLFNHATAYETLVIDPITVYWELIQKFWSDIFIKRLGGHKSNKHEFFDLGPKEWNTIRRDMHSLFNRLLDLDKHIIITARETVKYKAGAFMVPDGFRFDGDKSLPYAFDIVLHLFQSEGKFFAECEKDRTEHLPIGKPFEIGPGFSFFSTAPIERGREEYRHGTSKLG